MEIRIAEDSPPCYILSSNQMIRSRGGSIVNLSSGAGVTGFPQKSIYVASKHAMLGLTKSAALEYAKSGTRINAIALGKVDTGTLKRAAGDKRQFLESLKLYPDTGIKWHVI